MHEGARREGGHGHVGMMNAVARSTGSPAVAGFDRYVQREDGRMALERIALRAMLGLGDEGGCNGEMQTKRVCVGLDSYVTDYH